MSPAGLPVPPQPFSWAIRSSNLLFVTHGPVQADGSILQGSIEEQAELTLQNFAATLDEVGADLSAMVQMTIYLLDGAHMAPSTRSIAGISPPPIPTAPASSSPGWSHRA